MRIRPETADILDLAADILRTDLRAALPEDKSYDALMCANIMSVAARQLRTGDGSAEDYRGALAALTGQPEDTGLDNLEIEFAARIRNGSFDPGTDAGRQAWKMLRETAETQVSEYNPKAIVPD